MNAFSEKLKFLTATMMVSLLCSLSSVGSAISLTYSTLLIVSSASVDTAITALHDHKFVRSRNQILTYRATPLFSGPFALGRLKKKMMHEKGEVHLHDKAVLTILSLEFI